MSFLSKADGNVLGNSGFADAAFQIRDWENHGGSILILQTENRIDGNPLKMSPVKTVKLQAVKTSNSFNV